MAATNTAARHGAEKSYVLIFQHFHAPSKILARLPRGTRPLRLRTTDVHDSSGLNCYIYSH
jgi:hypothetical protein